MPRFLFTVTFLCLGLLCDAAVAQAPATDETEASLIKTAQVEQSSLTTLPRSFEPYLDGAMYMAFESLDLVGAVISIVHEGQLALSKGYGFADLENRTPADPAVHLFRPGSVSKLFTWTAVMQLYQEGELQLDAPIAEYIQQFPIPDRYGAITFEHALTHTPGLEDGALGFLFVRSPEEFIPLAEALGNYAPTQQWAPGEVVSYSNWATALAGLAVANISGMTFEDYVAQHILNPLGMLNSTFDEPLPPALAQNMATGYFERGKGLEVLGYEYIKNFGPAGSLAATADDMARFIMAHVNGGELDGKRILDPDTIELMHSRLFGRIDQIPAMAHGFYEVRHNGHRLVAHGGDTIAFHSNLVIDPTRGFGFFMSFNAPEGDRARDQVSSAILDYFYPEPAEVGQDGLSAPEGAPERVARLVGTYRLNRQSHTKIERLTSFGGDIAVVPGNGNRILVSAPVPGGEFEEVEPYLFQEVGGREILAFEAEESGQVVRAHLASLPVMTLDKLAWYETSAYSQLVIGLALLASVFVIINVLRNWTHHRSTTGIPSQATWLLFTLSIVNLLFALGFVTVFSEAASGSPLLMFQFPPPGTGIILILPVLGILLTLAVLGYCLRLWRRGVWNIAKRLRYSYVTLVNVLFVLVLNYWNLIGWKYY